MQRGLIRCDESDPFFFVMLPESFNMALQGEIVYDVVFSIYSHHWKNLTGQSETVIEFIPMKCEELP